MAAASGRAAVPPPVAIAIAVFADLLAVSLVVPLLPRRYAELGISPALAGLVGSVYSAAQIVGGLAFGVAADRVIGRRTVLVISMVGAAISYAILGATTSLPMLVFSRLVVGLVKQTMTTSSAMVATWTTAGQRAVALNRLSLATTAAFLIGQALGGVLAKRVHPSAPPVVAVLLYILDIAWVLAILPTTPSGQAPAASKQKPDGPSRKASAVLRAALADGSVARMLAVHAAFGIVTRGLAAMSQLYEREQYTFSDEQLGFLGTWRAVVGIALQTVLISVLVRKMGERRALLAATAVCGSAHFAEALFARYTSKSVATALYVAAAIPLRAASGSVAMLSMKSLYSQVVPEGSMGTALAALDIVQSASGVAAPVLGGAVLQEVGARHYTLAAGIAQMGILLLMVMLLPKDFVPASTRKAKVN